MAVRFMENILFLVLGLMCGGVLAELMQNIALFGGFSF